MGSGPVTLDLSTFTPLDQSPEEKQAAQLQQSVSYGAQHSPDEYAKLLALKKQTGVPPAVSQGNEAEVQHAAAVNSIDYQQMAVSHPRTTAWASNPDNAAVAGVDEIHRLAGIEKNAQAMHWYDTPVGPYGAALHPIKQVGDFFANAGDLLSRYIGNLSESLDPTDPRNRLQGITLPLNPYTIRGGATPVNVSGEDVTRAYQNVFAPAGQASSEFLASQVQPDNAAMLIGMSAIPTNTTAGKALHTAIAAYFSGKMGSEGVVQVYNAYREAEGGNVPEGVRQLVGGALNLGMAYDSGRGGAKMGDATYHSALADTVASVEQSKLRERSPEAFQEAMQRVFEGQQSLRIPAEQFYTYFQSQKMNPAQVAQELGIQNYAEAKLSGGDVELKPADFLSKLDPEHQKALLPDIIDPNTGKTPNQAQAEQESVQKFIDEGGLEKLQQDVAKADAETQASPEYQSVKTQLHQQYIDAGETPEIAENYATLQANVYSNLARETGMKAEELMSLYRPVVKNGEAPGTGLKQSPVSIAYDESGNVVDGDGRHRVIAALERGDRSISIQTQMRDGTTQMLNVDPQLVAEKMGVTPDSLRETDAQQAEFFKTLYQSANAGEPPRGWFRVMPDGSFEIGKTSIGDLSTFVHEPAHSYLEIIKDLATKEWSSDNLKGDYQKILDFLGAKEGDKLTTEQHEKWARANEQYLREGKAPSEGLKGVFQRFAVWLTTIYKRASDLGVNLSDDIRGVFDRMYASEDGVNRAAKESGPQLFTSPEEAGWTPEQFQKYADSKGMEVEQAKSEILGKMNEAAVRERSDAWREEENNVREAVSTEIDAKQEYQAIRALRDGKLKDGSELKLNREELVKQFGEERVKELQKQHPGLYRKEGGVDADIAAEILGYGSGDEMLKKLMATPRRSAAIEAATREYMIAKHGDIRYDGTLNDQARIALENDKKAANSHKELVELRKKLNETKAKAEGQQAAARAIQTAPIHAYREAAKQMVENKAVADIQPHRYLDATRVNSKEAFDALKSGDVEKAADAKHKELMNHFLFREAVKAKEFISNGETYAKRMSTAKELGKLGMAGQSFLDQIRGFLNRYGFTRNGDQGRQENLSQFLTRMKDDENYEIPIDPILLDESQQKNYRNVPLGEFRAVIDGMKAIDKAARMVNSTAAEGKRVALNAAAAQLESKLFESLGEPEIRNASDEARSWIEKFKGSTPDIAVVLPEFTFERWDGRKKFGPWHEYFWDRYNDAVDHKNRLLEKVWPQIEQSSKANIDGAEKFHIDSMDVMLTKNDILSIAHNAGNESNLDKQMRGGLQFGNDMAPRPITPEALMEILGHLTPEDINLVNSNWRALETLKPDAAELARKRGTEPKWIETRPLQVKNGTLEGGYWPVHFDPRFSAAGEKQVDTSLSVDKMFTKYASANTNQGYLIERTGYVAPLSLDWQQTMGRHLNNVVTDISHWEFASDAQRLLKHPQTKTAIISRMGELYYKNLLDWVRNTVKQGTIGAEASNTFEGFRRNMRSKVSTAVLGFRVANAVVETGITPVLALQQLSPGNRIESSLHGVTTYLRNPVQATKFAAEASDYIRHIDTGIDRNVTETIHQLAGDHSLIGDIRRWSIQSRVAIWKIGAVMAWHAGYHDAMTQGLEGKAAVRVADSIYRMTQESGRPGDLSAAQRDPRFNELTMFIGPSLIQYNNLRRSVMAFKDEGFTAQTAQLGVTTLLAGLAANTILFDYLRGKAPDDKKKLPAWMAARMVSGIFDGLPILNQIANYGEKKILGETGGDPKLIPVLQVGKDSLDAALKTNKAFHGDAKWAPTIRSDMKAAGSLTGLPMTQGSITGQYIYDVMSGQYKPAHPWSPVTDAFYARPKK